MQQLLFFDAGEFQETQRVVSGKPKQKRAGAKRSSFNAPRERQAGCGTCNLHSSCRSPFMEPYGDGDLGIFIVAEAPCQDEDRLGRPLVGESGRLLNETLAELGISMDRDCIRSNVLQCHPPANRTPNERELQFCYPRIRQQIEAARPELILTLGHYSASVILQSPFDPQIGTVRGRLFNSGLWDCWVGCLNHPADVLRGGMTEAEYLRDTRVVLDAFTNAPGIRPTLEGRTVVGVESLGQARDVFAEFKKAKLEVNLDYETTGLSPYQSDSVIVSFAISNDPAQAYFFYLKEFSAGDQKLLLAGLADLLTSGVPLSGQNTQFEWKWTMVKLGVEMNNVVHDSMIGEHVLDERERITSLEHQTFRRYGSGYKESVDRGRIENTNRETLRRYNGLDAIASLQISNEQRMEMDAATLRANEFFTSCLPALNRMSHRGLFIDLKLLKKMRGELKAERSEKLAALSALPVVQRFNRGHKELNPFSGKQLQEFFFSFLNLNAPKSKSAAGNYPIDADVLETFAQDQSIEPEVSQFCSTLLEVKKIEKMDGTYLKSYEAAVDGSGFVHPEYCLHTVRTYRSSCKNPNGQNIPNRDPFQRRVRKVFIPVGDYLLEVDYSGAEVRVLAMYSRDKNLIAYVQGGVDFHAHWTARIYNRDAAEYLVRPCPKERKAERDKVKGCFVFALFYGSWWKSIAHSFPEIDEGPRFWQGLEDDFYNEFWGVREWQQQVARDYERLGYVETFMGFRRRFPIRRNEIINSPIQATSFHMLLDAARRADIEIQRLKMRSRLIGQIHDSILGDTYEDELPEFASVLRDSMVTPRWAWERDVPMEVEFEIGKNWYEMEKYKLD